MPLVVDVKKPLAQESVEITLSLKVDLVPLRVDLAKSKGVLICESVGNLLLWKDGNLLDSATKRPI